MKLTITSTNLTYGVLNVLRKTEPRIVKNLLITRLLTHMAPDSNGYMRNAFDKYYRNQGYVVYPRDQYCLRKILGYPNYVDLSMALTYQYQRYHFNVNKLDKVNRDKLFNSRYKIVSRIHKRKAKSGTI